jgi:carbonic anhydrase
MNTSKDDIDCKQEIGVISEKLSRQLTTEVINNDWNSYHHLIENNKDWCSKKKETEPDFFKKLSQPQHPEYLVICCSDSRIAVESITEMHPGSIFSHRNIGNQVMANDINVQSVIQYAVEMLKVKHIIVIGHTDCGAIKASLALKSYGLIDYWLTPIREVAEKHYCDLQKVNKNGFNTMLAEYHVKEQVLNVCKVPVVQKAWGNGQELFIHGCLFEIETGCLRDLGITQKEWKNVKNLYELNFDK